VVTPDGLRIRGGVGGLRAETDDLRALAGVLTRAGVVVQGLAGELTGIAAGPVAVGLTYSPVTAAAAEAALLGCVAGPAAGLLPVSVRLVGLGAALHRCADGYQAAERAADQTLRLALAALLGPVGAAIADPVTGARLLSVGLGSGLAAGPAIGLSPSGRYRDGHGVTVIPSTRWRAAAAPTGVADLAVPIATLEQGGPITGSPLAGPQIRVQRLDRPGGTAWVVDLAGTRDWSLQPGPDPFDLSSDLHLLGGRPSDATAAVLAAMAAAGIRPGQPVLIAGHSQGGMVAAAIAADPAVRRRFTVTHLLTLGSPISRVPVPAGIQVLSIEHAEDPVPGLDGAPDPDRPTWVSVRAGPVRAGPELPELPVPSIAAHQATRYLATALRVDASSDPSVRAWRRSAAIFLDDGTAARSQVRSFTAVRSAFG
jgi:hypothetical protein